MLGAQFVWPDKTALDYKFYALRGRPPARLGLVHISGPRTAAIAVEIWSLPKTAMGVVMESIPDPLAIGSVELAEAVGSKVLSAQLTAQPARRTSPICLIGVSIWRTKLNMPDVAHLGAPASDGSGPATGLDATRPVRRPRPRRTVTRAKKAWMCRSQQAKASGSQTIGSVTQ